MKYHSSDEPAWEFLGDECQNQCLIETWSGELKTKASIKRRLEKKKKIEFFFWVLA